VSVSKPFFFVFIKTICVQTIMLLPLFITSYFLIAILFFLEYRYESLRTTTTLQTSADDRGTTRLLLVMWFLSLIVAPFWTLVFAAAAMPALASWIGLILLLVGIAMLRWTTYVNPFYLRTMATTDDHFICTDGPYKRIRHPGYLAFLLAWLGFGLVTENWVSFLMVSVLMLWTYLLRIAAEEQMMLDRFGVDYQQYMNESYR
jgi:protein-S-isoprenylcysteine O-methyltransferase Ste14